jgi:hypothetical protein
VRITSYAELETALDEIEEFLSLPRQRDEHDARELLAQFRQEVFR